MLTSLPYTLYRKVNRYSTFASVTPKNEAWQMVCSCICFAPCFNFWIFTLFLSLLYIKVLHVWTDVRAAWKALCKYKIWHIAVMNAQETDFPKSRCGYNAEGPHPLIIQWFWTYADHVVSLLPCLFKLEACRSETVSSSFMKRVTRWSFDFCWRLKAQL